MLRFKVSFLRNSFIILFSTVLAKLVPFLLQPVLTEILTPKDYGLIELFLVSTSIFIPILSLGMPSSVSRGFFYEDISFKTYQGTVLSILFLSFSFWLLFFVFNIEALNSLIALPKYWIVSIPIFCFFEALVLIRLTNWLVEEKSLQYGLFQVLLTLLDFGLTLVLLLKFSFDYEARLIGKVATSILMGFIGFLLLYRNRKFLFAFSKTYSKKILTFSLPLVPHIIGNLIINASDRIFLAKMAGLSEMGIYSLGYQIGQVVIIIGLSFNRAWQPWLFKSLNLKQHSKNLEIIKYSYFYFFTIISASLIIGFAAPYLLEYYVNERFWEASKYIIWVALGYGFNSIYFIIASYYFYLDKTKKLGLFTIITAILNITLNYVLIKYNGPVGAAQATTISFAIQLILVWHGINSHINMPWKKGFIEIFKKNSASS